MQLSVKQTLALDYLEDYQTTDVMFGGGAGGGKSIVGTYWLLKSALKYPNTRWLMGRSELKTLKETTLVSFFKVAEMQGLKANIHYHFNQQTNTIHFPNKSVIILKDLFSYPSDPNFDSLGSLEISGAFIDECNQVTDKARRIVRSRIRHGLDENKLLPKMLMTCNPSKNWVYTEFYRPYVAGELPINKVFIKSLVTDNDKISKTYYENLLALDEISKQRLLYGNFEYDDDPAALLQYDKILDMFTNHFDSLKGNKYITADIARLGSDKIVICVWDGWLCRVHTMTKERLNVTGEAIEELRNKYGVPKSNIVCDEDGVGGGVVDFMKYRGFVNNSKPLPNPKTRVDENYNNLKSQCYFRLAERINKGGVGIICDDPQIKSDIIQELEQVKQHNMDKDGKKMILPKDLVKQNIGRSPDFADALMMREWFELKPKIDMEFYESINQ